MTTQTRKPNFTISQSSAWKDLFVVASLAIVLGAFVVQISTSHATASSRSVPVAAATTAPAAQG
ncbi:MAG: hypothetical protein WCK73_08665 [Deltaproteobacteria bacterium]